MPFSPSPPPLPSPLSRYLFLSISLWPLASSNFRPNDPWACNSSQKMPDIRVWTVIVSTEILSVINQFRIIRTLQNKTQQNKKFHITSQIAMSRAHRSQLPYHSNKKKQRHTIKLTSLFSDSLLQSVYLSVIVTRSHTMVQCNQKSCYSQIEFGSTCLNGYFANRDKNTKLDY